MTATELRSRVSGLTALAGAAAVAATALASPAAGTLDRALDRAVAEIALRADQGWIMSGTGQPDPTVGPYLDLVKDFYLQPGTPWFTGQQTFPGYDFQGLTTPEQFCPFVCLPPPNPQLSFADSLAQGMANLDTAIRPQLEAGDNVTVFGYSQSATIATLEMQHLLADAPGGAYDPANLHFVLIGDPNNPISGILTRLAFPAGLDGEPQHIPFLGIPASIGAGPTDFATDIYSNEYDGWTSFPQDPTNLLAVVNALMGILAVHGAYFDGGLADAVHLGSIGANNFYMIPEALPILGPLYQLGDFGKVVGDALAPGAKLAIDWAYGNPGDPGAGFAVDGVDPIGAAGPWAATASGHLSDDDGAIGFLLRMDPLQMLAGAQYAGVYSLVNPINDILGFAGQDPLSASVVDALLGGYHLTNELDQALLTGWQDLATQLNVADTLGPDAIFNGAPLISGEPLLGLVGFGFDLVSGIDA